MTITELDNCHRIDDANGKRIAYFYFDTIRFPLDGGQSKEEAYRSAAVCLDALAASLPTPSTRPAAQRTTSAGA